MWIVEGINENKGRDKFLNICQIKSHKVESISWGGDGVLPKIL